MLSILYFFPLRTNKDTDDAITESNPVSTITSKGLGKNGTTILEKTYATNLLHWKKIQIIQKS